MLTQKGSKDFVVYTERSIHPWGVPQTQITPTIVNKVLKVNITPFDSQPEESRTQTRLLAISTRPACHLSFLSFSELY
ncbi:hypothetical protein DPMN_022206 [Dreissena polymorpha]|uniref:Uncharacterized protein n=1 Tax=Dreissena polymorpha TaxID=45954 RepID=A0A9D4ES35_DREPO|nr:hypothetical protein DPMN_162332 [Dreissena polymorpha]KAH3801122.1 hypothetical protein DPMN_154768 [Dreissena polymorpha]KAH3898010.1 hypothetical protein DPMN_022206 [Dreissena polymorpha]